MHQMLTAVRSYRSLGDFTGPLAGDASKRRVALQCCMCLGFFPSCVNTVQGDKKKGSDFSRVVARRNGTGSFCAPTAKKKRGSVSGINQTHVWFWFFFSPSEAEKKWKFKREDSR